MRCKRLRQPLERFSDVLQKIARRLLRVGKRGRCFMRRAPGLFVHKFAVSGGSSLTDLLSFVLFWSYV